MKCVSIQYIEAIRQMKDDGYVPLRTIALTFVPDEEIGGCDGFGAFLAGSEFQKLGKVAFALDEGLANPDNKYTGTRIKLILSNDLQTKYASTETMMLELIL